VQVLAAADPANPYGATLAWPIARRLQRVSGANLIMVDGEPALYLERSRKGLITLPAFEASAPHAIGALRRVAENAPRRELVLDQIDGESALNSALRPQLEQAGFVREYLGLTLRLPALAHPQARSA
jgi:ATP-dependent Lhr-like helicase